MTLDYIVIDTDNTSTHCVYARQDGSKTAKNVDIARELNTVNALISEHTALTFLDALPEAIERLLKKGYRCQLKNFITLFTQIELSATDYIDENGETVRANADMLNPKNAKTKVSCSVNKKFSEKLKKHIEWEEHKLPAGVTVLGRQNLRHRPKRIKKKKDNNEDK